MHFATGPDERPSHERSDNVREADKSRPLTTREAYLHLFKGNVGPGLLALPLSFAAATPALGLLVTLIVVLQGAYGQWLLVRVERSVSSTRDRAGRRLGIEEVGEAVFGRAGRIITAMCILVMQLGVLSVFIGLVAENLRACLGSEQLSRKAWVLITFVPCALLSQLPDLSSLWPLSLFGNVAMLTAILSTCAFALVELAAPGLVPRTNGTEGPSPPPPLLLSSGSDLDTSSFLGGVVSVGSPTSLIACAANAFYAYEGVAVVLPIAHDLESTAYRAYAGTLLRAVSGIGACFLLVGGLAGAAYPQIDSASVTAYLSQLYSGAVGGYFFAVNVFVAVGVLATFPLQLAPAGLILDQCLPASVGGPSSRVGRCLIRLLVVCFCALLVATLDSLDDLIDLVGAVANTSIAALPCLAHARLMLRSRHRTGDSAAWAERAGPLLPPRLHVEEEEACGGAGRRSASSADTSDGRDRGAHEAAVGAAGASEQALQGASAGIDAQVDDTSPPSSWLIIVDALIVCLCAAVAGAGVEQAVAKLVGTKLQALTATVSRIHT